MRSNLTYFEKIMKNEALERVFLKLTAELERDAKQYDFAISNKHDDEACVLKTILSVWEDAIEIVEQELNNE